MVLELYPKIYEKRQKNGFRKNVIVSKLKEIFISKFDMTI